MPDKTPDHLESSPADTDHVIAAKDHLSGKNRLCITALGSVVNELLIDRYEVGFFICDLQLAVGKLYQRLTNSKLELKVREAINKMKFN